MRSRSRSTTVTAAVATLAATAAVTSGCGGTGGTITVGAALPAAEPVAAAVPLAADGIAAGPGTVATTVARGGYEIGVRVTPNRATTANRIVVSLHRAGVPVAGARVALTVNMTTMDMGTARYLLHGAGSYTAHAPAWIMSGTWQLAFAVTPPGGPALRFALDDDLR